MSRGLMAAGALCLLIAGHTASALGQSGPFQVTSATFKEGEIMPRRVANNVAGNANCVGENVSPQLSWSGVPAGTKSLAITMIDTDGGNGAVYHLIVYGISPSVTSMDEGELSRDSTKFTGGKNARGGPGYAGPCTPPGMPHHYVFVVTATDFEPGELPPGLTIPEFWAKLPGRSKGATGVGGLFRKPD